MREHRHNFECDKCGERFEFATHRGAIYRKGTKDAARSKCEGHEEECQGPKDLAGRIMFALFTNGVGERAERLALKLGGEGGEPEVESGGWGRESVRDLIARALEGDRVEAVRRFLSSPVWPERLEARTPYDREADEGGGVRVFLSEDGDAFLSVASANMATRFCTLQGGGQSPRVRAALLILAEAIRLDNEEPIR
jgi:hypothetical protein